MAKTNEANLRDVLDETAREISELSSNPRTWASWMVYLLGRLEAQAAGNPAYIDSFKDMLASLQDELRNRLKTGGW